MGVAGCGKSSLGTVMANALGMPLVEGDHFHSHENRRKMTGGIALTDADRDNWLSALAMQLQQHPEGMVLTCSALKSAYRNRLRKASAQLRFVFMDIPKADAIARVAARSGTHFFSPSLIDSQFATLELPTGEAGVLRVDATQSLGLLQSIVSRWLKKTEQA
jgi:gluconokinase